MKFWKAVPIWKKTVKHRSMHVSKSWVCIAALLLALNGEDCTVFPPAATPLTQTSLLQTQVRKSAPSRGWSRGDRTLLVRRPPSPPRSRNPVPAAATPPLTPGHSAPFSAKLFHQVQTHPVRLAFLHSFFFLYFFFFFLSRPYIFSGVAQVCFSGLIVVW